MNFFFLKKPHCALNLNTLKLKIINTCRIVTDRAEEHLVTPSTEFLSILRIIYSHMDLHTDFRVGLFC